MVVLLSPTQQGGGLHWLSPYFGTLESEWRLSCDSEGKTAASGDCGDTSATGLERGWVRSDGP